MDTKLMVHIIDELRVGGAQTHLLTTLVAAGELLPLKHIVICLFGKNELIDRFDSLGIPVICLNLEENVRNYKFLECIKNIKKVLLELEPTHIECHLTWSRVLGLPAAWLADVPFRFGFEHGDIYLQSLLIRSLNFLSQFFANKIIFCSQSLADIMAPKSCILKSKFMVLLNGVDPTRFKKTQGINRGELGVSKNGFLICGVGTLGRGVNKRFDIIIKAVKVLSERGLNVELVICGDGEQKMTLEHLAKELGISEKVKLLGSRNDIPQIMSVSDLFCHAAPFEPFGLVIVEAMLCSLAVVVPDSGGPKEIVTDGVSGLRYKPLDINNLAEKIELLFKNKDLRSKLAKRGYEIAFEQFTISRYIQRLYSIYGLI